MFSALRKAGFQIQFQSHAEAILSVDFPDAVRDIESALKKVDIPIDEIIGSGGGEAKGTQRLRKSLSELGWNKVNFVIEKTINGERKELQSHEIDHVRKFKKGTIALEIEWNNKDPFFDRDLENFKRLHAEGGISIGIIVTRGASLQDSLNEMVIRFARERRLTAVSDLGGIGLNPTPRQQKEIQRRVDRGHSFAEAWADTFVADKFGAATTHWSKLEDRVSRGVGNPCPLLLIGLPASVVSFKRHGVN